MMENKRSVVIAGNWKMNMTPSKTTEFLKEALPLFENAPCQVLLCVPFVCLPAALEAAKDSGLQIGAQNMHFEEKGAFTGEISAPQLCDLGVSHVIIGHSERREYFGETDLIVQKKIKAALLSGLCPILCVGETLEQRENQITKEHISMQIKIALSSLSSEEMERVMIAYEPIWAIGTGKTATPLQAEEICAHIRGEVSSLFSFELGEATTILYGGSMNPSNAKELLALPNVDGGLIGGASLVPQQLKEIISSTTK